MTWMVRRQVHGQCHLVVRTYRSGDIQTRCGRRMARQSDDGPLTVASDPLPSVQCGGCARGHLADTRRHLG